MKRLLAVLTLAASCSAQNVADVVRQGEQVFAKTCATGYCHGVKGTSSGAPRLAGRADRLCLEHEQFLHRATELCRLAEAGTSSMAWWRELSSRCHKFSKQLMHHESEENKLLQQAHQDNIGASD